MFPPTVASAMRVTTSLGIAIFVAFAVGALPGCGSKASGPTGGSSSSGSTEQSVDARPAEVGPLVAFLGDSIAAGSGVEREDAFPAVVHRIVGERGFDFRVLNAGRSGDTTAGGLARVDWILAQSPDLVVIELGGNDGLRGQPIEEIATNLRGIVTKVRAADAEALLLGMRIPTSYGEEYAERFAGLYPALSTELEVEVVPFFMESVAGRPDLNQPDGIHPTRQGHRLLAESLAPVIERWLSDSATKAAQGATK